MKVPMKASASDHQQQVAGAEDERAEGAGSARASMVLKAGSTPTMPVKQGGDGAVRESFGAPSGKSYRHAKQRAPTPAWQPLGPSATLRTAVFSGLHVHAGQQMTFEKLLSLFLLAAPQMTRLCDLTNLS